MLDLISSMRSLSLAAGVVMILAKCGIPTGYTDSNEVTPTRTTTHAALIRPMLLFVIRRNL